MPAAQLGNCRLSILLLFIMTFTHVKGLLYLTLELECLILKLECLILKLECQQFSSN
ncbi:Uncharacterized protein APZ42_027086 [Daphnia magna]|uniref:Uncharacterized protein n=1 Tax=Daphnia magna TaxID=35525 RepID=A0A164RRJ7_9CRUS|nr:Uncharacterized protein APZ42_027086 [Daphnia magna]